MIDFAQAKITHKIILWMQRYNLVNNLLLLKIYEAYAKSLSGAYYTIFYVEL